MQLPKDKQVIVERHNKVVYDCGDTVVKVFNATKPASAILNEALNLSYAAQAGIDVPEFVEVSKAGANWALATKKVEGKTLRQLISENPSIEQMNTFVELELQVHTHRCPTMIRQKDKYARMINSLEDVIDPAIQYELLERLEEMPDHDKVCHGDFVPSNIIVRNDGSVSICDWAHATQGNGAADCATTYLHLLMGGEAKIAEMYLRTYCDRQGCSMAYVQSWMAIVAAAELGRGRAMEKEFLLSMVDEDA